MKDFLCAQLSDCRKELEICEMILDAIKMHPHTLTKKEAFHELAALRDEAYHLLQENGTFFTNREWQNMILGNTDEQFGTLIGHNYTEIIRKERRRSTQLRGRNPDAFALHSSIIADPHTTKITNLFFDRFSCLDKEILSFLSESFPSNPYYPDFTLMHPRTHEIYIYETAFR